MNASTRQYAYLADHSYGRDERGNTVDLKSLVGEETKIGGVFYKVLAYSDRPSGYQGAVYQRVDTGEIIVAHRGTEFDRQTMDDLVKTDGGMALTGSNRQAADAIALTRQALKIAESIKKEGDPVPSITVTGHSLGGTLAQISGHYFGLKGETFNAYGAAGMTVENPGTGQRYRLPQGGHDFVNHVMAGDLVSAAAPQYGQVRVYAAQREIDVLQSLGYENDRSQWDIRFPVPSAVRNMLQGSHDMHNFLPWDGERTPDQPVQEQA